MMTTLDAKSDDDHVSDVIVVEIKAHSKTFTTTYGTIKNIPYLKANFLRWHDRTMPMIVDIADDLLAEILAEHTIVDRTYLGLDEKKKTITVHRDSLFFPKDLVVYMKGAYMIFEYKGKIQVWQLNQSRYTRGKHCFTTYDVADDGGIIQIFTKVLSDPDLCKDFV